MQPYRSRDFELGSSHQRGIAKSRLTFLCNMNQYFANETQIDKFRLNCYNLSVHNP